METTAELFNEGELLATEKATHYAMVAFDKQAGRFELTINMRTPLIGKAVQ